MSKRTSETTPERLARILVIGAGGNVSKFSVPQLVQAGHKVTGLVRNPDHVESLVDTGASVLVQDITELNADDWAHTLRPYDVVVWSAGAGGGSSEKTYAVDRDAALAVIDALETMGESAPRLIMVSYLGSTQNTVDEGDSMYAYVESKKTVDNRIYASGLDYIVLGPSTLSDEPAAGIETIDTASDVATDKHTPRELVAQVITVLAGRSDLSTVDNPLEFVTGDGAVADL